MAAYDLEEQEQLAELKAWWKQYGNLVTGIVVVAALAVFAWQGWNWYQRKQAAEASVAFSVLQRAAAEGDTQKAKSAAGELVEKYGRTAYAAMGALTAAKALYESGDLKSAKAQLNWVVENGNDEFRDLGRLRLAAVLLDEKAYEEALKALSASHGETFAGRFAELTGDIYAAQGKNKEALTAYTAALSAAEGGKEGGKEGATARAGDASRPYSEILQQKIDALGGGK